MRTYLNNSSLLALFLALFFTGHVWAKTIDCTLTGNVNGVPSKILINYALKRGTNRFDDKGITVQMNRQYTQSLMKMLGAPITWQVKGSGVHG